MGRGNADQKGTVFCKKLSLEKKRFETKKQKKIIQDIHDTALRKLSLKGNSITGSASPSVGETATTIKTGLCCAD